MTIEQLQEVVDESGKFAQRRSDDAEYRARSGGESEMLSAEACQWMRVKMLAEIARQLAVANRSKGTTVDQHA